MSNQRVIGSKTGQKSWPLPYVICQVNCLTLKLQFKLQNRLKLLWMCLKQKINKLMKKIRSTGGSPKDHLAFLLNLSCNNAK